MLHGIGENKLGEDINQSNRPYRKINFWTCLNTWKKSSKNTLWCLAGCCIGDFGTIAYFQLMVIEWPVLLIMSLEVFLLNMCVVVIALLIRREIKLKKTR